MIGSIVRSAMGVKLDDMSPEVDAKLIDFDFEDLDNVRFIGKTGKIERGKLRDPSAGPNSDRFDDKTTIACGVTPDMEADWKAWKDVPRGFDLDDGLDGAMTPASVASVSPIDPPPWAD